MDQSTARHASSICWTTTTSTQSSLGLGTHLLPPLSEARKQSSIPMHVPCSEQTSQTEIPGSRHWYPLNVPHSNWQFSTSGSIAFASQLTLHVCLQQSPPSQPHSSMLFSLLHAPLPVHTRTHSNSSLFTFCSGTTSGKIFPPLSPLSMIDGSGNTLYGNTFVSGRP